MKILGIESSCDETSVAVLENEKILTNLIYSQVEHHKFGGVVPEVASRAHLEKIDFLTCSALQQTGLSIKDIDLIAVTDSPGLAGALLVGVSFALGLHVSSNKPITGIHHLEGHIYSAILEHGTIPFPFLALIVSGGHTVLYRIDALDAYHLLGETVDDAAGEAFDKVGKLLGFSYPAGRAIEEEASRFVGDSDETLTFPVAQCSRGSLYFSFSGLKTAVKNYIKSMSHDTILQKRPAICNAFQRAVTTSLVNNALKASTFTGINRIVLAGGVACNNFLREALHRQFRGTVFTPRPGLCTDNAGMIARAGYQRFLENRMRMPRMNPSVSLQEGTKV